jgi:hypothetical protein
MKIKLLKPIFIYTVEKQPGLILEVTKEFGERLIADGDAQQVKENFKPFKNKK